MGPKLDMEASGGGQESAVDRVERREEQKNSQGNAVKSRVQRFVFGEGGGGG